MPEALIFGERERVLAAMRKERREHAIQNMRRGHEARRERRYAEIRELILRCVCAHRCARCGMYPWEHDDGHHSSAYYVNNLYCKLPAWMPQDLKRRNEIVRAALHAVHTLEAK